MTSNVKDISKFRLSGCIAATFTPMHPNGDVNFDILEEYMDKLVSNDVSCVFVNGTTGEGLSMTIAERKAVAEKWITLGKTRFQAVIIHVGATCLKDIQDLARHAEQHGADAISTLPPLFFKPSCIDDMIEFLKQAASAAPSTPFFYYHNPIMVGCSSLKADVDEILVAANGKIPSLVGAKFTHDDLHDYGRCQVVCNGRYQVINAIEEQALPALTLGGEAFIGSTYNYAGKVAARMLKAFKAGDVATAQKEQFHNQAAVSVLKKHGPHVGTNKAIMSLVGPEMGPARPPLHNPSPAVREEIRKDLEAVGFFDWIK